MVEKLHIEFCCAKTTAIDCILHLSVATNRQVQAGQLFFKSS